MLRGGGGRMGRLQREREREVVEMVLGLEAGMC